ncbi:MAG: hemolysin family protein [Bdellovibrionota bacterium]|jgi:putative hemolysin
MDPIAIYYWIAIFFCFLGSTFFSGTETALTSLSPVQAEKLAADKGWFSKSLKHWIDFPNRLLATNLLGNTLVNTAAATLTASYFQIFHPQINLAIVTGALTIVILIVGEIAPKMFARSYSEFLAPFCCRVLVMLNYVLYPLTQVITQGVVVVLRAFGVVLSSKRSIRIADIERMVLMANRDGSTEKDKTKILSSVFEFSKRRVKDVMIPKDQISALSVDSDLIDVLDTVRRENHSRYPVYKSSLDRIIGFLHARDLFSVLKNYAFDSGEKLNLNQFSLRTCLRRAFFVSEHSMISNVLNEMKKKRIHLAIVKDEWANVVGLITLEDILEEVFGEIEDEHDERQEQPVIDLFESGIEVEGDTSLSDLRSKYEIELEASESYSTLNGFLQHYASHQQLSPRMVIIWKNYIFTILSVVEGQVEKIRINQLPDTEED